MLSWDKRESTMSLLNGLDAISLSSKQQLSVLDTFQPNFVNRCIFILYLSYFGTDQIGPQYHIAV